MQESRIMLVSAPQGRLIDFPNNDAYSLGASQVLAALLSFSFVKKIYSVEFPILVSEKLSSKHVDSRYVPLTAQSCIVDVASGSNTLMHHSESMIKLIRSVAFRQALLSSDTYMIEFVNPLTFPAIVVGIFAGFFRRRFVVHFHDVASSGAPLALRTRMSRLLLESILVRLSTSIVFFTEKERGYVTKSMGRKKPSVAIPLAVDFYMGSEGNVTKWHLSEAYKDKKIVLFMGALGTASNVLAVEYILKELSAAFRSDKDVLFVCAGQGFERWVDKPDKIVNSNVLFTGKLPRPELDGLIEQASICIAPLSYNTGIKTKILDACIHRKPVLASRQSMPGLPTGEMPSAVFCELSDFPKALSDALRNVEVLQSKTESSANYLEQEFGFQMIRDKWRKFFSNSAR